ncbi:Alpha/beta hydrolase family protein [Posidoniimonas polymericola]|uniref:Alpha/beta hydrolase family protein n=2 Tax=Posidoniimonas polymericola TaxID=2528002 RepID=A0A5C5XVN3_9BACT|nr:Alpha/beta hydrolase family protein [Posidoniimonas polymericola]
MIFCSLLLAASACASTIQMDDGRTMIGDIGQTSGVAEDPTRPSPSAGEVKVTPILIIDDGLRRTFVNKFRVRNILDVDREKPIVISVWQDHAEHGAMVGAVGRQLRVTPFDDYGRRIYEMQAAGGSISVVQGITEVTPTYTRVRGLNVEPRSYVWDQRLATSSIPRETLSRILQNAVPENNPDARLQIVRLYLQAERYTDARRELESVLEDFPQLEDLRDELHQLRQLGAKAILDEIELRQQSGQHKLVRLLLENFPAGDVDGKTLERVREMLVALDEQDARIALVHRLLDELVAAITEPAVQRVAGEIQAEIKQELNAASLDRMTAFINLADGDALDSDRKAALAISGWLLGSNQASDNLASALSLFDVRAKVLAYLRAPLAGEREKLLIDIRDSEAGDVRRVAQLLKLVKPPLPLPEEQERSPGVFELGTAIGPGLGNVRYLVQLPPEYDPLQRYPTVISLNGAGFRPEMQLDYWAGGQGTDGVRRGQAMRHGYITIAVDWLQPHQYSYGFTADEHQKVLAAYRDALRRLSIDTDRVYLSGHDIGSVAAWDIALAHPDLWAGVIPVLAAADEYIKFYTENALFLSWYFVCGELDGDKIEQNAYEFDRYLKPKVDTTIVELLGRGHEPFTDEIQRLFDWMGRKTRRPSPEEFEVHSMRPWDNYFWWVEFDELPAKSMVSPSSWPPRRGTRPARLIGRKYPNNKLGVRGQAGKTTVWLSPDLVDFDKPIEVEVNGRRVTDRDNPIEPELRVLLEDARTRGERQRPYWAKLEYP